MKSYTRFFLCALMIGLLGPTLSACLTCHTGGGGASGGAVVQEERIRIFVATNFDRLKEDIAKGHGEHLGSLATLLGVPSDQRIEFYTFTQEKFPVLFPSPQVTAEEMVATLTRELSSQQQIHRRMAMN